MAVPDPVIGIPIAPWWKRLVAGLVDSLVIGAAGYLIEIPFFFVATNHMLNFERRHPYQFSQRFSSGPPNWVFGYFAVIVLVYVVGTLLYFGFLAGSKRGQTVGMMALGLAVRDAATGGPIGFWRAALRQLVALGLGLLFEIPLLIDLLSPLWDKRRQAWHDHAARSLVIDTRP